MAAMGASFVEALDYERGYKDGLAAAAKLVDAQEWPMFKQPNVDGALKSKAWIRNAILRLKK